MKKETHYPEPGQVKGMILSGSGGLRGGKVAENKRTGFQGRRGSYAFPGKGGKTRSPPMQGREEGQSEKENSAFPKERTSSVRRRAVG